MRPSIFSELYLGSKIAELTRAPTSLEFVRDFVAKNVPVVIRGTTSNWPAVNKWNSDYFRWVNVFILPKIYLNTDENCLRQP